jgi:hypothetical protein
VNRFKGELARPRRGEWIVTNEKMVENLWSLANGITSFAVLQALAFLYALGRPDFVKAVSNTIAQTWITVGAVVFAIAYSTAVWECWMLASALYAPPKEQEAVWTTTTWGRVACIVMFNLMVVTVSVLLRRTHRQTAR